MITILSITVLLAVAAVYATALSQQQAVERVTAYSVYRVSCFHCGFPHVQFTGESIYYCVCSRGRGPRYHIPVEFTS